jgi:hypothetical protein
VTIPHYLQYFGCPISCQKFGCTNNTPLILILFLLSTIPSRAYHEGVATPTPTFFIHVWALKEMGQIFCYGQLFYGPKIDVSQVSKQHHLVGPPYTRPARKPPHLYMNLQGSSEPGGNDRRLVVIN